MIIYKSRWLKTGEVWFDEEPAINNTDIVLHRQRSKPLSGANCTPFYTILTDLSGNPDEVLSSFTKDTRYEIRRADTKDAILYEFWNKNSANSLRMFYDFYNNFAAPKGLPPANESYLKAIADAGALDLSCCRNDRNEELVWHAYYRGNRRVRLLHSASLFRGTDDSAYRSLVGRANRFHHWQDMLRFKAEGISVYDMGGWYNGKTDEEKLRINKFKEEFGGSVVQNFNCVQVVTLKARIVLSIGKLLGKGA